MRTPLLIATTLLANTILWGDTAFAQTTGTITSNTVTSAVRGAGDATKTADIRVSAERFVEHINYARVALAMNNSVLAKEHITKARTLAATIKAAPVEQLKLSRVESGRLVYDYDTSYKYHYFPIEAGPVEVKTLSSSAWADKGVAVKEAEIVYLSLDLSGDNAEKRLAQAETDINEGKLKDADKQLAELTDEVVDVDDEVALPLDKARDNIALARNFAAMKNYDGARFALRHADNALDDLEKDDNYKDRRVAITSMRKEVKNLEETIKKNDPNLLNKADTTMKKWWSDLKGWTRS